MCNQYISVFSTYYNNKMNNDDAVVAVVPVDIYEWQTESDEDWETETDDETDNNEDDPAFIIALLTNIYMINDTVYQKYTMKDLINVLDTKLIENDKIINKKINYINFPKGHKHKIFKGKIGESTFDLTVISVFGNSIFIDEWDTKSNDIFVHKEKFLLSSKKFDENKKRYVLKLKGTSISLTLEFSYTPRGGLVCWDDKSHVIFDGFVDIDFNKIKGFIKERTDLEKYVRKVRNVIEKMTLRLKKLDTFLFENDIKEYPLRNAIYDAMQMTEGIKSWERNVANESSEVLSKVS